MNTLRLYAGFFIVMVFLSGCSNKQNEYYPNGKMKTEYIRKAPKSYLVNKYDEAGSRTTSVLLKNGEMDGVMKVYFPSSHKIKGRVYYKEGNRTKMFLYNRSGRIIIKRFFDNRDKLDSALRFFFKPDFALERVFIVDSTKQMLVSKQRLQKFNKEEFTIINDSIIHAFNKLNQEKEEIGCLLRNNGFKKGSVYELFYNNEFEWDYVRDSLDIDAIVDISTPVYFTKNKQDYMFIYISTIQSGAVGYGAFWLIRITGDQFEIVKEFTDFVA